MPAGAKPNKVVVGIIDDGIAFAHERFRNGDKSRIEYFWLQDGVRRPGGNVAYGREFANSEINDLLTDYTRAGTVNEDGLYLRAGLFDFRRRGHKAATWRASHGTHVMDLACGLDQGDPMLEKMPVVCVQLPARATANTSGTDLTTYAIDAFLYIRDRVDEMGQREGKPLPLVVNFSYGIISGPHDGTSKLEWFIDRLIAERELVRGVPFAVVLPSGNSHLLRCHAELSFPAQPDPGVDPAEHDPSVARLHWRVLPDDKTPSFLDIWMPPRRAGDGGDRVTVTVTPPGGAETDPPLGDSRNAAVKWRPNGRTLCSLQHYAFPAPTRRSRFRVTLRPTALGERSTPTAPAGTWTVTLRNIGLRRDEVVHAWVQRDESLYGYPRRGRQSHFEHPRYERFEVPSGREKEADDADCPVKRAGLISAIATGSKPVVVGGFIRNEGPAAKYSAGGPTTPPAGAGGANRDGPNAMAVSEQSRVHSGILAAGSRSGSVVAMNGTSVAAPQIAHWIAKYLLTGQTDYRAGVAEEARKQEAQRPHLDPTRPSADRGGAGRIATNPIVILPRNTDETAGVV